MGWGDPADPREHLLHPKAAAADGADMKKNRSPCWFF